MHALVINYHVLHSVLIRYAHFTCCVFICKPSQADKCALNDRILSLDQYMSCE